MSLINFQSLLPHKYYTVGAARNGTAAPRFLAIAAYGVPRLAKTLKSNIADAGHFVYSTAYKLDFYFTPLVICVDAALIMAWLGRRRMSGIARGAQSFAHIAQADLHRCAGSARERECCLRDAGAQCAAQANARRKRLSQQMHGKVGMRCRQKGATACASSNRACPRNRRSSR